jgi:hypothetical protein
VRIYADRIVVAAEGQIIAEHTRTSDRLHTGGHTIYDWRHYLSVVQRKPGALRNGAPFADLPDGFKRLQAILLKRPGGDREMVEIIAAALRRNSPLTSTADHQHLLRQPHCADFRRRLVAVGDTRTFD